MEQLRLRRTAKTPFSYFIAGIIFISLILPLGCSKEEPTAPVSFKPPGVYSGTYYVIRNWQSPDNEMKSLAYVKFDFTGDLNFTMTIDSPATGSDFNLCNVSGTYLYRNNILTLSVLDSNVNYQTCNPTMCPNGDFTQSIVQDYVVFIRGADSTYRKINLIGR